MGAVERAVWFIENRFGSEVTLDAIAEAAGVSRFHLCRLFGVATGQSVMRYVRGRRLTEAARVLAAGASDILAVALDAGYGSHEAFTRAFRDQFGLTAAEAVFAAEISRGDGLQAVAERLAIAPTTARTHLTRIFEKTGTRRQAELVRLLMQCDRLAPCGRAAASAHR